MQNPAAAPANPGGQHQTQGFPSYQPVPPPATGDPRFLAPRQPRRGRAGKVIAVMVAIAVAVALGLFVGRSVGGDDGPLAFSRQAGQGPTGPTPVNAENGNGGGADDAGGAAAPGGGTELDLRKGAVFVQSNDPNRNEVVAFARNTGNGRLHEVGRYDTGGTGSGSFEDTAEGVVLGTPAGESGPQHYIDGAQLLFVTNAGSNEISVFRVNADGLELVGKVPSGGEKPVSLTVNRGLLYVLNSGELDDRFILSFEPLQFLDNCTHGDQPTVTGFRIANDGTLTKIQDTTRPLSGGQQSGCSQVSFSPDGSKLLVSERLTTLPKREPGKGAIVTFDVNDDGTLGAKKVQDTSGEGPFGFGFSPDGTLLVTEQNHAEDHQGHVSSYTMLEDGTLKPISKEVANQQTDTCWVVTTGDGRLAFASSALGGGSISSYRVDQSGGLTLLKGAATADQNDPANTHLKNGTTDLSLSQDSKYLYQLNSHFGTLQVFAVNDDGGLTFVEEHQVFDVLLPEQGGQLTPFGIAAI